MFVINEDNSIYATRGDIVFFNVTAEDDGVKYTFKAGDVLRIKVYGKKDAENVVLQKDFPVGEDCEAVEIFLTEEDTKIGEVISKPKDYWYEVELNPYTNPQTIVGYDDDGAKVFKLFPEGKDIPEYVPEPEDIPVVDEELDMTSTHPVQNQAVSRALMQMDADVEDLLERTGVMGGQINNLLEPDVFPVSQNLEYLDFITEGTKAKVDGSINSDGVFAKVTVNLREANLVYSGTALDMFVIPSECRPVDVGLVHTAFGMEFRINYDKAADRYYMSFAAQSGVSVAPTEAGSVTFSYALGAYEVKDIRLGADGVTYDTAGEAVRKQIKRVADGLSTHTLEFTEGMVLLPEGKEAVSEYWCLSNAVKVLHGMAVYVKTKIYASAAIGFFDASGKIVSATTYPEGSISNRDLYEFTLEVPENTAYMKISCYKGYTDSARVEIHNVAGGISAIYGDVSAHIDGLDSRVSLIEQEANTLAGKKVLVLGDSISDNTYRTPGTDPWDKWASVLAAKLGYELTNDSLHATGFVADTTTTNKSKSLANRITKHTDAEEYDLIVLFMGVNDYFQGEEIGDSHSTDKVTYVGAAMRYCLDYLVNTYPAAKICALLPLKSSGYASLKNGHSLADYVDAYKEVYGEYSVPTLDLFNASGYRPTNKTFRERFTMLAKGADGSLVSDGIHPNQEWDNNYLAPQIENFLTNLF